jgi:hypothetical protein
MMRGWSKQGFLNPASSNDDGWYKFSIRPDTRKSVISVDIQYIIADCSNKSYLDFGSENVYLNDDGTINNRSQAKRAIKDAKARIKKIQKFNKVVAESAVAIEQSLEQFIADVETALDNDKAE